MRSKYLIISIIITLSCIALPVFAVVRGDCANCHTMHNSQNGIAEDAVGPRPYLLKVPDSSLPTVEYCVGCHFSDTAGTIVDGTPIVYNATEPLKPLAGGNFYWVVNNGDEYGHNVRGISGPDSILNVAPGSIKIQEGCGDSCHKSLTLPDYDNSGDYNNGCEGCHQSVKHHTDHPEGQPVPSEAGWYRFLSAPPGHVSVGGGGVYGIEDPLWEVDPSSSRHNIHYGGDSTQPVGPDYFESISAFCAGCHFEFHSPGFPRFGIDNGGGGSPWLRHPTDYAIPDAGEFGDGKVINTAYDPVVPVGKQDLNIFDPLIIEEGDMVICMSCHRAHGSDQPDMLRWDYETMITGTTGDAAGTGCFQCHTDKDGN